MGLLLRLRLLPELLTQAAAAQHDKGWPRDGINKPVEDGETVVFGSRDHLFLAPNYHMTELQAAVGLAQLAKLPAMVAARQASAQPVQPPKRPNVVENCSLIRLECKYGRFSNFPSRDDYSKFQSTT